MNPLRIMVIFSLFINLGLTLGADILTGDVDDFVFPEKTISVGQIAGYSVRAVGGCPDVPASSQKCPDPSHLRDCHFGHCSVVFRSAFIGRVPDSEIEIGRAKFLILPDEPFIEGLRRPPRVEFFFRIIG